MQDIDPYEKRLATALLRIGAAAERLAEPPPARMNDLAAEPDTAAEVEIARLTRLLDEAQAQNADLSDRLAALRERHVAGTATLEGRVTALLAQVDAQGVESQRLRMVNVELREAMRALREALSAGGADPGQINRALLAEVEALESSRQIETAELEQLLAVLDPLLPVPAQPGTEAADA